MTGIHVVRGRPDADELAALLAVLTALSGGPPADPDPVPGDDGFGRRPPGAPFAAADAWVRGTRPPHGRAGTAVQRW